MVLSVYTSENGTDLSIYMRTIRILVIVSWAKKKCYLLIILKAVSTQASRLGKLGARSQQWEAESASTVKSIMTTAAMRKSRLTGNVKVIRSIHK